MGMYDDRYCYSCQEFRCTRTGCQHPGICKCETCAARTARRPVRRRFGRTTAADVAKRRAAGKAARKARRVSR